jgi:hypothetical protein
VREDFQSEFSSLAPRGAATDEGFEASLDHRHYGLDLNATAVGGQIEASLHEPQIAQMSADSSFIGEIFETPRNGSRSIYL